MTILGIWLRLLLGNLSFFRNDPGLLLILCLGLLLSILGIDIILSVLNDLIRILSNALVLNLIFFILLLGFHNLFSLLQTFSILWRNVLVLFLNILFLVFLFYYGWYFCLILHNHLFSRRIFSIFNFFNALITWFHHLRLILYFSFIFFIWLRLRILFRLRRLDLDVFFLIFNDFSLRGLFRLVFDNLVTSGSRLFILNFGRGLIFDFTLFFRWSHHFFFLLLVFLLLVLHLVSGYFAFLFSIFVIILLIHRLILLVFSVLSRNLIICLRLFGI